MYHLVTLPSNRLLLTGLAQTHSVTHLLINFVECFKAAGLTSLAGQALSVGGVSAAQVASAAEATRRVVAGVDEVTARIGRVLR